MKKVGLVARLLGVFATMKTGEGDKDRENQSKDGHRLGGSCVKNRNDVVVLGNNGVRDAFDGDGPAKIP